MKDRQKMSRAKLGKRDHETNRWLGNEVGYDGLHDWVYKKLGAPMQCQNCDKVCENNYQIHWANKSGEYKRDVNDWLRLCVPCHSAYDRGRKSVCHK